MRNRAIHTGKTPSQAQRYQSTGHVERSEIPHHDIGKRDRETGLAYRLARYYDSDAGRFLSTDPLAGARITLSPYNYVQNNPVSRTDPNGALDDWYRNEKSGEVKWFASTAEGFSDLEGNSWSNLGSEMLSFDGSSLTYSWQTGNEVDGFKVHKQSFDAVSGQGSDPTNYWNVTKIFDYSRTQQKIPDVGPIPEGLYSIRKSDYSSGTNESGTQSWKDIAWYQKSVSIIGFGLWPGGTNSWGDYRWKLQFENASLAEEADRRNFYLHGGSLWGSRGCIDCGMNINTFYRSFIKENTHLVNDKVYLNVQYTRNLKFEIQNRPASLPLNILTPNIR